MPNNIYPSLGDTFYVVSEGVDFGEYKVIAISGKAYGVEKDDAGIVWVSKSNAIFLNQKKLDDFNNYFLCRIPLWTACEFVKGLKDDKGNAIS